MKIVGKRSQTPLLSGFVPFVFIIPYGHLHASLLINAGIDVVAVSGDLGHAQVSTTINILKGHTEEKQPCSTYNTTAANIECGMEFMP